VVREVVEHSDLVISLTASAIPPLPEVATRGHRRQLRTSCRW
jgi:hypothetical protein